MTPSRRPLSSFATAFAILLGWLLVLNSPHLGVNAALHWDAEASITWGPTAYSRAELADARAHLYDVLGRVADSDDPRAVTNYYWSPPGLAWHEPLTRCRAYYGLPADVLGHAAFAFGRWLVGTPLAAVLCYQWTATAITAAALAGLWTMTVGPAVGRGRRAILTLTFAAVASSPVVLSLARQVLQETPAFALGVAAVAAVRRRSVPWMAVAGLLAGLAVRTRYTLGPTLAVVLPLAAVLADGPRWRWALAVAFVAPVLVLLGVDLAWFGPFALPWVYDGVMVRSARLFFHADPPYGMGLVAVFVTGPLLAIPAVGIACYADGDDRPGLRAYAVVATVVLAGLLWRALAQQVQYQPRHLFAVADGAVMLWLLVLPRVRWRPASGAAYVGLCGFYLVWNVCSTFGSQRNHSLAKLPDAAEVVTRHLAKYGDGGGPHSLARDLWPAYFDWADARVLHDTLTVWAFLHRQPGRPVLVIDAHVPNGEQMARYAAAFPVADVWRMAGRSDPATVDRIRQSAAPVYVLTANGRRPPPGVIDLAPPVAGVDLIHATLHRVAAVAPAAVELDAGAAVSASADGLTITRVRGEPRRFDAAHGYLPRVQPEWLSYDGDPTQVAYDVAGLDPARRYAVGFVTWDADRRGRAVAVSADGVRLTTVTAVGGMAPPDEVVPLPVGRSAVRLTFDNRGVADVAVCEVWVAEVGANVQRSTPNVQRPTGASSRADVDRRP